MAFTLDVPVLIVYSTLIPKMISAKERRDREVQLLFPARRPGKGHEFFSESTTLDRDVKRSFERHTLYAMLSNYGSKINFTSHLDAVSLQKKIQSRGSDKARSISIDHLPTDDLILKAEYKSISTSL